MDMNQQDRAVLRAKRCPDCGQPINSYFFEPQKPWCKACDVWFEMDNSSGWVIRNQDATYQYNQQWAKILENTRSSTGL